MTAPSATVRAAFVALLLAGPAFAGLAGASLPARAAEIASAGAGRFVLGLGDVPAMPGLGPSGEEPLVFDKPAGRIAQTVMAGRVDRDAVRAFYDQTMPQLGWTRSGESRYLREGEELRLDFATAGKPAAGKPAAGNTGPGLTVVRFTLSPR